MDKILYTITETAYFLNCSTGTIYKLIHEGRIPYVKRRRNYFILYKDIEDYAKSCTIHAQLK